MKLHSSISAGVFIYQICLKLIHAQDCPAAQTFGKVSSGNTADGLSGHHFLLAGYEFDCCGVVTDWNVRFKGTAGDTYTVSAQIWRPVTGAAGRYELIGENDVTGDCPAAQTFGKVSSGNTADGLSGHHFLLAGYEFDCCGVVTDWNVRFKGTAGDTYTVSAQIWRPVTGAAGRYELIGENDVTGDCPAAQTFGKVSSGNTADGLSGHHFLLAGYEFDCCGVVTDWNVRFKGTAGDTYTVSAQIWRPVTGAAGRYELIGENDVTGVCCGDVPVAVAVANRISVIDGDVIGWYSAGFDVIGYNTGGGESDPSYPYPSLGDLSAGATVDWSSITATSSRTYAIEATTDGGNAPTVADGAVTITNHQGSGAIATMVGTDADVTDVPLLTYSDQTGNAQFSLNTTTGEVSVTTLTDKTGTISLTINVADPCGNTGTGTLNITIQNDPPAYTGPFNKYISEDISVETQISFINVTDVGDTVTCSLSTAGVPFLVRPNGTEWYLRTQSSPGFNYDTTNQYDMNVSCTDGVTPVIQVYTIYLLENQAPVMTNLQNSTTITSTLSVGQFVFQVLATDNENDNINFTLACSASIASCPFSIVADGTVSLAQDITGSSIAGYDVSITVYDAKNTGLTLTLTINIADINDAVLLSGLPLTVSVNENNAVGFLVHQVSYTDSDTGQSHTWTLSSSPTSAYFDIGTNGEATLTSSINFESLGTTTYVLTVTVADALTSDTGTLTVIFQDVNEAPTFGQASYGLSAVEAVAGTAIGTPTWGVTDQDASDSNTLTMDCGTYASFFQLNSGTGAVSLQTEYDLDSGSLPTQVVCGVTATDAGGLTATTNLTITFTDVNDNTPTFAPDNYVFFVSWYASIGTTVGTLTASDGDTGIFGDTSFTINQAVIGAQQFAISTTGVMSLIIAPQSAASGVNYTDQHVITVIITDAGGLTDTATVTVVIGDTTTTSATTTTDPYMTFFEFPSNLAWFVILVIVLFVIFLVSFWLAWTCRGPQGCMPFLTKLRRICHRGSRKLHKVEGPYQPEPQRQSVRQAPPSDHTWQRRTQATTGNARLALMRVPVTANTHSESQSF